MTLGLVFWIIMLIWLVFDLWSSWPNITTLASGRNLLLFILLLILGWHAFGPPIHG